MQTQARLRRDVAINIGRTDALFHRQKNEMRLFIMSSRKRAAESQAPAFGAAPSPSM